MWAIEKEALRACLGRCTSRHLKRARIYAKTTKTPVESKQKQPGRAKAALSSRLRRLVNSPPFGRRRRWRDSSLWYSCRSCRGRRSTPPPHSRLNDGSSIGLSLKSSVRSEVTPRNDCECERVKAQLLATSEGRRARAGQR